MPADFKNLSLGPNAVVHAQQDYRAIIIGLAGASLRKHGNKRVCNGLRPNASAFHSGKQFGKQTKGRQGEALKITMSPSVPTRGFGSGSFLDDGLQMLPSEGRDGRESRKLVKRLKPGLGIELMCCRVAHFPP